MFKNKITHMIMKHGEHIKKISLQNLSFEMFSVFYNFIYTYIYIFQFLQLYTSDQLQYALAVSYILITPARGPISGLKG